MADVVEPAGARATHIGDGISTHALDTALGTIRDVVFQVTHDGRVTWMSTSVQDLLGYDAADLIGANMLDLVHPDDAERAAAHREALSEGLESPGVGLRFRTSEGTWREVFVRARPLVVDGVPAGAVLSLSDEHEAQATRRALATVLAGTAVLVRARTQQQLLDEMCRAVIAGGGYAFCWYGVPRHDEAKSVDPVAIGGDDRGYVEAITVSWDADSPYGQGPTGESLRTGTTQLRDDLAHDPHYAPWLDQATGRRIACSISLPVLVDGRVHGSLMVYSTDVGAFEPQAQEMLEGLAADLGYGLERLEEAASRRELEHQFRLVAENASDVVFLTDENMMISWVSPSSVSVLGWEPQDLVGRSNVELLHPDDVESVRLGLEAAGLLGPLKRRVRFRQPDGSYRWVSAAGRGFIDDESGRPGRVVAMRDVTGEVRNEAALAASEGQFRLIAENALDVVIRSEFKAGITWVSPSVREVLGWAPEDLIGSSLSGWIHPDDLEAIRAVQDRVIGAGRDTATVEFRIRRKGGAWIWVRNTGRLLRDPDGAIIGGIDTFRDIDSEVDARSRAAFETTHDGLTGLLNRTGWLPSLTLAVADPHRTIGLLAVGVDDLKAINEAFTHTAGDRVLIDVAQRLVAEIGSRERVARTGDNEFTVVVDHASPEVLGALAARLLGALSGPVSLGQQEIGVTVSIGVVLGNEHEAGELMRDVSTALHQARQAGGNRWEFLDPRIAEAARHLITVQTGLRDALLTDEIQAWFQPIVSLEDGSPRGYEALVRWVRDDGTVVPPDSFLPVAERSDLIVALDHKVLGQALDVLAGLPSPQHIAVNIAAATLTDPSLFDVVRRALERSGVDAPRLHLEVTETSLVKVTPEVVSMMRAIAGLGITWWVDDFGTGYSSISHLRDMPIGGLKLDRSFTSGVTGGDTTHQRLAQGLVGLAHGLELATVAEGVETEEQAEALRAQGWGLGQGWLYGRPTPPPLTAFPA